jgi:hypothetical protein
MGEAGNFYLSLRKGKESRVLLDASIFLVFMKVQVVNLRFSILKPESVQVICGN